MMTNTEKIFHFFDTKAKLEEQLYLEGIVAAGRQWLTKEAAPELTDSVTREEIRRGIQLAVLKGMKASAQPHHQMTPDALAVFIGFLAKLLVNQPQHPSILDPAAGTGNLLFAVMNAFDEAVTASAVEIDEILVRLAATTAELLEQPVTFYVQDALRPLFVDPVDLVVSDLPVGYYPDDDHAVNYEVMATEGHAYAHHLFLEQSMNYLKTGGFGIFLVPRQLFESEQAGVLLPYLQKKTWIRAILQLPMTLFKNASHAKSILILQKPSLGVQQVMDVLIAEVPDMTKREALAAFLQKMDAWAIELQA